MPNPLAVLRRAGYSPFRDPVTNEDSFVIRLTPDFYPRFHLYAERAKNGTSINLHLDQKKASYGNNHAHNGEYEGPVIEREMDRIHGWVKAVKKGTDVRKTEPLDEKGKKFTVGSWIKRIFFD